MSKGQALPSSEQGVFLPVLAVIVMAVLAVIISFGIDNARTKAGAQALAQVGEAMCRSIADHPTVQFQAFTNFQAQVQRVVVEQMIPGVTLTEAQLIIPTMPSDGVFRIGVDNDDPTISSKTSGSALTGTLQSLGCDGLGLGETCDPETSFSGAVKTSGYPALVWNNRDSVGNTVGCELRGVVARSLGGYREVGFKTVWRRTLRGDFSTLPIRDVSNALTNFRTSPGLTIAVAPHMTTSAADDRFRFTPGDALTDPAGYEDDVRELFDPLLEFDQAGALTSFLGVHGAKDYPPQTGDTELLGLDSPLSGTEKRCVGDDTDGDGTADACINSEALPRDIPAGNFSDREEMMTACLNPAVLIRNIFLMRIAELASRDGLLRRNTEVLMAGTQARTAANREAFPQWGGGNDLSAPVLLVPGSEDLARADYDFPFVYFDGGDDAAVFGNFTRGAVTGNALAEGAIEPFRYWNAATSSWDAGVGDDRLAAYHSLAAQQLRVCYHMYHNAAGDENAVRITNPAVGNGDANSVLFEPAEPTDGSAYRMMGGDFSYLRETVFANDQWDFQFPWQNNAGVNTRLITPGQVLGALGTVQSCPYEIADLPDANFPDPNGAGGPLDGVCVKPPIEEDDGAGGVLNQASLDLRPDILGLMNYLQGIGSAGGGAFEAVESPGLRHFQGGDHFRPFGAAQYHAAENTNTSVLLFTHKRLTTGERDAIKALRPAGRSFDRPITIVFMPTSLQDATDQAITDFIDAFGIGDVTDAAGNVVEANDNPPPNNTMLLVLSPFLDKYQPDNGSGPYQTGTNTGAETYPDLPADGQPTFIRGTAEEDFRDYWHYLLMSGSDNILSIADNIFYGRLTEKELAF